MSEPTPEEFKRETLIDLCMRGSVDQSQWRNRDSGDAQKQLGECLYLLRAGCEYIINFSPPCETDEKTIWVEIAYHGFAWFERGEVTINTFYIPTEKQLNDSFLGDWY